MLKFDVEVAARGKRGEVGVRRGNVLFMFFKHVGIGDFNELFWKLFVASGEIIMAALLWRVTPPTTER